MSDFFSVFITAPSREDAEKISQTIVRENLAACANILPGVRSIYRWQGKIEQSDECAIIAKITAEKFEALQARVAEIHSYECPCIVAWPIVAGNEPYLKWLEETA